MTSKRDSFQIGISRDELLDRYSAHVDGWPEAVVATALRTRSVSMRDLLVRWAVRGYSCSLTLRDCMLDGTFDKQDVMDPLLLGELGRLVLLQNILEEDLAFGQALLSEACRQVDPSGFPLHLRRVLVQHYVVSGQLQRALALLKVSADLANEDYGYLLAEIRNPFSGSECGEYEAWLEGFNRPFLEAGLSPIELKRSTSESPFDRLTNTLSDYDKAYGKQTPLVSVVLTAYKPDAVRLYTSVSSILCQTWRNFELIIVDDCSGEDYKNLFQRIEQLDSRVRVIHTEENRGTYVARNIGYEAAHGEYITGQDDDDWSHPERIETQVNFMRQNPNLSGCRTKSILCDEDLNRVHLGYRLIRGNASSLLIDRAAYVAAGGFLEARKSADNEFFMRVPKVTNRKIVDIPKPLSLLRSSRGSLSRSEFSPGWKHSARRAFQSSYRYWHSTANKNELQLGRGAEPAVNIPARFKLDLPSGRPHVDIVFAADWRYWTETQKAMLDETRALREVGYRVGILQLESARNMREKDNGFLHANVQALINERYIEEVVYDEPVRISLIVLRLPEVLQFLTYDVSAFEVEQMLIVAERTEYPDELEGLPFRVEDCTTNATRAFNVTPTWTATERALHQELQNLSKSVSVTEKIITPIVDVRTRWHERVWYRSTVPVVGRYTDRADAPWPSSDTLTQQLFPTDGTMDVRFRMGPTKIGNSEGARRWPRWTLIQNTESTVQDFLLGLDYLIAFPDNRGNMLSEIQILEALASGIIVILPETYEGRFGNAAVYSEPDEVRTTVHRLHKDFALYREQLLRAKEHLEEHFSYEAYQGRVRAVIGPASEGENSETY